MPGASSDEKMEECFRLATTTYPDAKYIVFQENMRGACLTLIATEGLGVRVFGDGSLGDDDDDDGDGARAARTTSTTSTVHW